MTVSVNGGKPVSLGLNRDFVVRSRPFWSPDGDAILFGGVSRQQPGKPEELWIVPIDGGEPRSLSLPGVERDDMGSWTALAWVRSNSGSSGSSIPYSRERGGRSSAFAHPRKGKSTASRNISLTALVRSRAHSGLQFRRMAS